MNNAIQAGRVCLRRKDSIWWCAVLDLPALIHELAFEAEWPPEPYEIGDARFDFGSRRYLVGVINLSDDSQYPESIAYSTGQALRKAEAMQAAGASIVEFGAQSTRPGARSRTAEQHFELLGPVLERCRSLEVPIAVETASSDVAVHAVEAGVNILNVVGYQDIDRISCLSAEQNLTLILPYLSGTDAYHPQPIETQVGRDLAIRSLGEHLSQVRNAGVTKIVIDPGLGFYFPADGGEWSRISYQLSWYLHLYQLRIYNVPILVTLTQASAVFEAGYRRLAEPVLAALALIGGTNFIRTHEIGAVERVRCLLDHADPV